MKALRVRTLGPGTCLHLCDLESEPFLCQVAETDNYYRREQFGYSRIDIKSFNKEFDEVIIKGNTGDHQKKVPYQLYSSSQCGTCEYHIPVKVKAGRETNRKSNYKSGDVGTHGSERSINDLLLKNKIITDKINENVKQGVPASAGHIPEGLQRQQPAEWRIKKIYN
jgi:hypothetical protein